MANPLDSRRGRYTVFFLLYLSEGLPLGLNLFALSAFLRSEGVDIADVGAFGAAVMAPWGLKFLWSPFIDIIRIRRFGPSRFWIVLTQTMMAVTLAFLFWLDPAEDFALLVTLMTIHNVFSSAQDVAIDGLAVRVLPDSELSWANGLMFSAQNIGMAVGGGGSLILAGRFGFSAAFALVLGTVVCLLLTVSVRLREPVDPTLPRDRAHSVSRALASHLQAFFRELYVGFFRSGRGPLAGLVFAVLPWGAVSLAGGLFTAMQIDLGFTETQIAAVTAISLLAAGLGCAFAGFLAGRFGAKRMLGAAYVLTALPTFYLGYLFADGGMENITAVAFVGCASVYGLFFGLGMGLAGAVFMLLTNPAVGATQFTGYMSLRNVAISYSAFWQGIVVDSHGYSTMLAIDGLLVIVPILVIPLLTHSKTRHVAV